MLCCARVGRCIACVPRSPDVTKTLFGARFGLAWRFRLLASAPPTPHSTAHRVARLFRHGVVTHSQGVCVGADRSQCCARVGGCIVCVPRSPDVTKIPVGDGFGLACSLRDVSMWGDHPRWWPQWIWFAALYVSIVDGARPASRRMKPGL